jgi:hypothetical protein
VGPRCAHCGAILCHPINFGRNIGLPTKPLLLLFRGSNIPVRACPGTTPAVLTEGLGVRGVASFRGDGQYLPPYCDLYSSLKPGTAIRVEQIWTEPWSRDELGKAYFRSMRRRRGQLLGPPGPVREVIERHAQYAGVEVPQFVRMVEEIRQLVPEASLETVRIFLGDLAIDGLPVTFRNRILHVPQPLIERARDQILGSAGLPSAADPARQTAVVECLRRSGWVRVGGQTGDMKS